MLRLRIPGGRGGEAEAGSQSLHMMFRHVSVWQSRSTGADVSLGHSSSADSKLEEVWTGGIFR